MILKIQFASLIIIITKINILNIIMHSINQDEEFENSATDF